MTDQATAEGGRATATQTQGVESYWPAAPESIRQTGLSAEFLGELALKTLFVSGPATLEELGERLGTGYSLTEELVGELKTDQTD